MITTDALILRTVNYKESDRILTLLSREKGKISVIAKGARKSQKRFGGALEPYALFEATLRPGFRGNKMFDLAEASMKNDHRALSTDLERIGVAAHILELTREVTPEDEPNHMLFETVTTCLELLGQPEEVFSRGLSIATELRILAMSGFAVSLACCNACGKEVPPGKSVFFDPLRGGVVCTPCGGGPIHLSAQSTTAFGNYFKLPLVAAATTPMPGEIWDEIEEALRTFVQQHLEKNLKTATFRRQVSGD